MPVGTAIQHVGAAGSRYDAYYHYHQHARLAQGKGSKGSIREMRRPPLCCAVRVFDLRKIANVQYPIDRAFAIPGSVHFSDVLIRLAAQCPGAPYSRFFTTDIDAESLSS